MRELKVLTSGYISMDRIIKINSPAKIGFTSIVNNSSNTDIYYGGCSFNISYALNKLGVKSIPIMRVGNDFEQIGFKNFLNKEFIPTDGLKIIKNDKTSTCYLIQDNNNNHITIFYPGAMDGKYCCDLEDTLFENCDLALITVASFNDNKLFFEKSKKNNIPIAFGMKDDFEAFPKEFLKELLIESKIIFTNEVECEIIKNLYNLNEITELMNIGKAEIIITTLGEKGSKCYIKNNKEIIKQEVGICKTENVVDATGSGDAYISGFIYGYLNNFNIYDCCKLGSALSYFVIQKEGCCTNIPTQNELISKFKEVF